MKKIKALTICGYPWKIISKDLSSRGILGETHPDSFKIYLHKELKGDDYHRVLTHEVIHAIFAMNGFSSHADMVSAKIEEAITVLLEHHIHNLYVLRVSLEQ